MSLIEKELINARRERDEARTEANALRRERDELAAEVERMRAELKGPDRHETWKDAAVSERVMRVAAEAKRDELARQNGELSARLTEIERAEPVAWRELSRRLYTELFYRDQQMQKTTRRGKPIWAQVSTVRDVLADASDKLGRNPPTAAAAPERAEPIGYLSPGQLYLIRDGEGEAGKYMPVRKTPRGLFTLPIYAGEPEQTKPCRTCGPDGCSDSTSCPSGER